MSSAWEHQEGSLTRSASYAAPRNMAREPRHSTRLCATMTPFGTCTGVLISAESSHTTARYPTTAPATARGDAAGVMAGCHCQAANMAASGSYDPRT